MTRRTHWLIALTALTTASCGESDSGVTIDTFNVALAGRFVEYEDERRTPLTEAIAEMDSDIVCLQEVFQQSDKDAIQAAAAETFPHAVSFPDNLDTEIDDPTDQDGQIPPGPPEGFVPCPGDVVPDNATMGESIEDQMNAAIDCVAESCSTTGDDQGQLTDLTCAVSNCFTTVLPLATGSPQQQQCYACAVTQLPSAKLAEIRETCPSVPNQLLSYEGQNGLMILSRYPLSNAENWVLPGTWTRRVINRATAELPDGKKLDIYCNHLTPIFRNAAFVYTGQYGGDGITSEERWEAEQFLQAQKLIDFVERRSGDTPAVILGDLNSGREFVDEGILAEGEPTIELLEDVFTPAYAPGYRPLCTFCGDNPLVDGEESVWIDHILLYKLGQEAVRRTERTFDEPVIEVGSPDGPQLIPLSDHYGMRSVIELP